MSLFSRSSSSPLQIQIQVETEVQVEPDQNNSHGPPTTSTVSSPRTALPQPLATPTHSYFHNMSIPRANYDPRRVCLNPFPDISLGKHRRTVGVYLAGALVCCY